MIRYPVTIRNLLAQIRADVPDDWIKRARKRTDEFYRQSRYVEDDTTLKPFWTELVPLYLRIQQNKCIYCERTLDDPVYGRVEMTIEHYRPKQQVHAWPSAYMRKQYPHLTPYQRPRGENLPGGYWSLAYHPLNLAVSCLRCNLRVKKSFFPINASRVIPPERSLQAYRSESPDLFYPFSTVDPDDPAECIVFRGPFAFPSMDVSHRHRERARVTIDLLHLNQRSELIRERCRAICQVYVSLILVSSKKPGEQVVGQQALDAAIHAGAPHVNCARCFLRLCQQDAETARMIYFEAVKRLNPTL